MSYTALYRKFRPNTFEDVKGQDHIVTTLVNQIQAGRIGHAYLFTGTRGTGKTTVAKILARAVNCENPIHGNPCGECPTCKAIASGNSMNVSEIDAASNNGVDNIREIVESVSYSPAQGKYKVYIIDEVHMLSIGAFNALLKTLEEPPSYVIFILATTEVHKIPITILSRCQRYDFRRIGIDTISGRLTELLKKEEVNVEEKAVRYIAKTADGSMRDALSLLDQCIAFHLGKDLTYDMVLDVLGAVDTGVFSRLYQCILEKDVKGCVHLLDEIVIQGRELTQFVIDFTWYLRNLMLLASADVEEDILEISSDNMIEMKEDAKKTDVEKIIRYIRVFSELASSIRYATQKRILIEIALIKLCRPQMESNTDALKERIMDIEKKMEEGIPMIPAGPSSQGGTPNPVSEPVKKAPLPKALPEDIQAVVGRWRSVLSGCDGVTKGVLKNTIPSLGEQGQLLIVSEEGYNSDFFKNDDHVENVKRAIAEQIGKEVEIEFREVKDRRERDSKYPNILECIGMDVEFES